MDRHHHLRVLLPTLRVRSVVDHLQWITLLLLLY
jgi:hypothetical protein